MAECVVIAAILVASFSFASVSVYGAAHAADCYFRRRRERYGVRDLFLPFTVPARNASSKVTSDRSSDMSRTARGSSFRQRLARRLKKLRVRITPLKRFKRKKTEPYKLKPVEVLPDGSFKVYGCLPYDDVCTICLDPVKEGDKMALLACRHAMHLTCVRPWLASHDTCPVCKIDLHDVHTRARRALSQRSTTPWNHGDRDDAAAEAALALVAAFSDSDSDSREGQLSADMSLLEGVAAISGQGCGGGGGGGRKGRAHGSGGSPRCLCREALP